MDTTPSFHIRKLPIKVTSTYLSHPTKFSQPPDLAGLPNVALELENAQDPEGFHPSNSDSFLRPITA